MTSRYRVLRIMAVVYKVGAWLTLIGGSMTAIALLTSVNTVSKQLGTAIPGGTGLAMFFAFELYSLLAFGSLLGLSEAISLLLDINRKTRQAQEKDTVLRPAA